MSVVIVEESETDSTNSGEDGDESTSKNKITFKYGCLVLIGISTSFLSLASIVTFFGFWMNLNTDDPVMLFVIGGFLYPTTYGSNHNLVTTVEHHFLPSTSLLSHPQCATSAGVVEDYPSKIRDAVGGVLPSNRIIICTGIYSRSTDHVGLTNDCYIFNNHINKWEKGPTLKDPRAYSAAANTTYGWWITGGLIRNDEDKLVATTRTEILVENGKWIKGPDLPIKISRHCLVQVNMTHTILIGGDSEEGRWSSREVWMIHWTGPQSGDWVRLANMIHGRAGHSCQYFEQKGKDHGILVAGGEGSTIENDGHRSRTVLASTEIFEASAGHWRRNLELPIPITNGTFVSSHGRPTLVGGAHSNALIQFEQHSKEPYWSTLDLRMERARSSFVGLMVRESSLPNCHNLEIN